MENLQFLFDCQRAQLLSFERQKDAQNSTLNSVSKPTRVECSTSGSATYSLLTPSRNVDRFQKVDLLKKSTAIA
jgi:hypothetical protein